MAYTFSASGQWFDWLISFTGTPFCYAVRGGNLTGGDKYVCGVGKDSADDFSSIQFKTSGSAMQVFDWPTNVTIQTATAGANFSSSTHNVAYAGSRSDTDHWIRKTGSAEVSSASSQTIDGKTITKAVVGAASNAAHTTANTATISEFAVWTVTLDDDDRAMIEAGVSMLFIKPNSLLFHWNGLATKSTTHGVATTITGSPTIATQPSLYLPA